MTEKDAPTIGAWGTYNGAPVHLPSFEAGKALVNEDFLKRTQSLREWASMLEQENDNRVDNLADTILEVLRSWKLFEGNPAQNTSLYELRSDLVDAILRVDPDEKTIDNAPATVTRYALEYPRSLTAAEPRVRREVTDAEELSMFVEYAEGRGATNVKTYRRTAHVGPWKEIGDSE